jgi:hypothetical protein
MRFSAFMRYWRKNWEYIKTAHQLFIVFKKAYDSVRSEVLYNIFVEFGIPRKLVWLIKMCLNHTHTLKSLQVNIYLIVFLSKMLKARDTLSCFSSFI